MMQKNFWQKKKKSELDRLRGSARWQRLRVEILTRHPLCVVCAALGRNFPAAEVHHIIPAAEMVARYGDEGFFREDNLAAVCVRCHDRNEQAWRRGVADTIFPPEVRG